MVHGNFTKSFVILKFLITKHFTIWIHWDLYLWWSRVSKTNFDQFITIQRSWRFFQRNFLGFSDDKSIELYHAFDALCYFSPLFGGILSDSYWGKVKTVSIIWRLFIWSEWWFSLFLLYHRFRSLPVNFRLALIKIISAWRVWAWNNDCEFYFLKDCEIFIYEEYAFF